MIFSKVKSNKFCVKDTTDLFHFCPMLVKSKNPKNPPKIKKTGKRFGISETAAPKSHKKQRFDVF